jgi:Asp-tRNA(Asn)/Glu-tRNA(Gln) amidotransferase B subunit
LKKEIENIIAANQEMYQKNPKTIIGICMKELRGKVDPARIMPILNSVLSS